MAIIKDYPPKKAANNKKAKEGDDEVDKEDPSEVGWVACRIIIAK